MNNKVNLNLLILETQEVELLGIGDTSWYPDNFQIITPTIQITPPSYPKITLPFTSKNLTIYNSTTLGISCTEPDPECGQIDLPDGIWKVKYTIAPADKYFVEKSFIRTMAIERQLGEGFLATDISNCTGTIKNQDKHALDRIIHLINGAIADANLCNDIAAMNKLRLAQSMLDNFLKTK